MTIPYTVLPAVNASLNALSGVLILIGHHFMRRGRIPAHRATMIAAVCSSALFLISYLYYHAHAGVIRFQGHGLIRPLYFTMLFTHTVLAAALVPLVAITLTRGLRLRIDRHKAIARWTYPIWLYVSFTGVLIYFVVYHWFTA